MKDLKFKDVFPKLEAPNGIDPASLKAALGAILAGKWTPVEVGALMVALRMRGENSALIAAAASALRDAMVRVDHGLDRVLDTCGTGGDGAGTLNISTGAALIAAAAGVPVAKHGNRAVSSKSGSADVLGALGVSLEIPAEKAAAVLHEANIVFLMAPTHHPAMRHAATARRELGIRSIFNCLGPLANPALATHQLLGSYSNEMRPILAQTLASLGTTRAWVVCSEDGLDEVSPFAPTRVTQVADGRLSEKLVTPEDFGLTSPPKDSIVGGDAEQNAAVLREVLEGKAHPSRDAFVLNAAAALVVAEGLDPKAAAVRAGEALNSGAALETLERLKRASQAAS